MATEDKDNKSLHAELEQRVQEAEKKARYYQKLAEQAGIARLRETETLSRLLARHKATEEQLRFQAELMEQMQDTIVATDLEGRITYLNESAARLLKRTRTELIGKKVEIFGESAERGATQQEILHQTLTHGAWHGIVINYASDGTERIFDTHTWLTHNSAGEPTGMVGISTDMTERIHKDEEISIILKTAHDGFSLIDAHGRFLDVNDTYCRMLGYSREEFLRLTIFDINMTYRSPKETLKHIKQVMFRGSELFESRLIRKDGQTIDVEISVNYMNIAGGRFFAFIRDITERKRAEERQSVRLRYEAGLAACSHTLLADGTTEEILTKAIRHLLLASHVSRVYIFENFEDPVDGLCCRQTHEAYADGVTPEIENPLLQHLPYREIAFVKEKLLAGEPYYGIVADLPPRDRRLLDPQGILSILILPIRVSGQWYGYIGFDDCVNAKTWAGEDIQLLRTAADMIGTYLERKYAEEEVRQARDAAEAANKAKSEFLSRMSHELKTPLNVIMGMGHLVLDTALTATQRQILEDLLAASKALSELIHKLLDFSKLETENVKLANLPFQLDAMIEAIFHQQYRKAKGKAIRMLFDISSEVPCSLIGDSQHLEQVLTHLLENAVKFTDSGEIALHIKPANDEAMSPERIPLLFSLHDTGIGIPPQRLADLFEMFHQIDGSSTRRYGGTGVGLAICQRLIQNMGGRIWAESLPGQGSTFSFTAIFRRQEDETRDERKTCRTFSLPKLADSQARNHAQPKKSAENFVDLAAITPLLTRFALLLEEHDTEATDYLKVLKKQLRDSGIDEDLQAIQSFLNDYNFEEALKVLHDLTQHLGITLQGVIE